MRGPLSSSLESALALEAARLLLGWRPDNQLSLPLHHSEHTVDATSHPADSVHAPLARFSAVHGQAQARCIFGTPQPGYRPQLATRGDHARAVAAAMVTLAAGLKAA
jgi:hypothetical protein